jgi:hypothetical protein
VTGALRDQFSICHAESHHVADALRDQFQSAMLKVIMWLTHYVTNFNLPC